MVKLFCIIDGETTPFSVVVSEDATVDDLKKASYPNINMDLDIKPKDLQLRGVPIGDEDKPIELKNQSDAKKLLSLSAISDVFNTLSKRSIHIIVEPPLSGKSPFKSV
ncbi:hypothetical protein BX616_007942 [Lobosporangium transversale]|uniref:Crinkler effector protein N-terminal domain-containing protein n=1 Tax=Lobosporangium transversale TaxID=64571 RepID=A0A1Y2GBQ2_9FUNG|nr:hypothetical protein BCR41DRAFT_373945 [Lobosporangium transversale]KAF9914609.1 hypothetical protein BX616_007942 [Lobosporangium transversale]ORZ06523.1 hypothetical protein BCR41DRAFT_373945 [Lobosporangium transversale]|eukprot:XP_021877566.1 hypothetical protein BCR41DRAFT_373945 [Lobosporangium transversale]